MNYQKTSFIKILSIIMVLLLMVTSLTADQILHWSGESNANDVSGNGYHATPYNITYVSGVQGESFNFNGSITSSASSLSRTLSHYPTVSISFWINPSEQTAGGQWLKRIFSSVSDRSEIAFRGQNIYIYTPSAGWNYLGTINLHQWSHIVITQNDGDNSLKCYINGDLVAEKSMDFQVSGAIKMGRKYNYAGESFKGALDEIKFYSHVLTPAEIAEEYDSEAPVITLMGNNPTSLFFRDTYVEPGYTVTDNRDPNPTVEVTGAVNTEAPGSYVLTYTATDASGNVSTPVQRTVTVNSLLTNGGFEGTGSGWSKSGNVWIHGSVVHFNEYNSSANGSVYQYVNTVIGQQYRLEFDYCAHGNTAPGGMRVRAHVGPSPVVLDQTLTAGPVAWEWQHASYTFTAQQTSTRIWFGDSSTRSYQCDLHLNNATLIEYTPPNAVAGLDQFITCVIGDIQVELDGSASTHPDGEALTYSWSEGNTILGTEAVIAPLLDAGEHQITLTVTDASGGSHSDQIVVSIEADTEDPTIVLSDYPPTLAINTPYVEAGYQASDVCDAGVEVTITGNVDTGVSGIYTLTYSAQDDAGNTSTVDRVVTVLPGSQTHEGEDVSVELKDENHPGEESKLKIKFEHVDESGATTYKTKDHAEWQLENPELPENAKSQEQAKLHEISTTAKSSGKIELEFEYDDEMYTDPEKLKILKARDSDDDGELDEWVDKTSQHDPDAKKIKAEVDSLASDPEKPSRFVVVEINNTPVADAGADQSISCAAIDVEIELNGSASSDLDGDILSHIWSIGSTIIGSEATIYPTLGGGDHVVTLTVTDLFGDSHSDQVLVSIDIDDASPTITLNAYPPTLAVFTPYVEAGYVTWDACDAEVDVEIVGTVNTDVPGMNTITYSAQDDVGNISTATRVILVMPGEHTPEGDHVKVSPIDENNPDAEKRMEIDFEQVEESGATKYKSKPQEEWGSEIPELPEKVKPDTRTKLHDVSTTAESTGSIEIEFKYEDQRYEQPERVRILKAQDTNGDGELDEWVDKTTDHDYDEKKIKAEVESISPDEESPSHFIIVEIHNRPVADAGADQSVVINEGTALIQLDGSGSSDLDNDIVSYSWSGSGVSADGESPELLLSDGVYNIVLTVTDESGKLDMDAVTISVDLGQTTEVGFDIEVEPVDITTNTYPVKLEFDEIIEEGISKTESRPNGPPLPDRENGGKKYKDYPDRVYYEIETDAKHRGNAKVEIDYTSREYGRPENLRLLHHEDTDDDGETDSWVDCTSSHDRESKKIKGTVSSFSPFIVVEELFPPVADAGADFNTVISTGGMASITLDGSGSTDSEEDVLTYSWSGSFGTVSGVTPTISLPSGSHLITLTVDDGYEGTSSDELTVTVTEVDIPPQGLLAYWPGNGDAQDKSGFGNHGTMQGSIQYPEGVDEQAFGMNNTGYVNASVSDLPVGNAPRAVSFWMYTDEASWVGNQNTVFSYGLPYASRSFALDMHSYPTMEFYSYGNDIIFDAGTRATGWNHIVISYDADQVVSIYVNNQLVAQEVRQINTAATLLNIGTSNISGASWHFNGMIDDFALYNRPLTPTEIDQMFQDLNPNSPPITHAGEPQTIECVVEETEVTLDGSASSDPDGDELDYSWRLGPLEVSTEPTFSRTLTPGLHSFTLTVDDGLVSTSANVEVEVIADTEAPELTLLGTGPFGVNIHGVWDDPGYEATDACDAEVTVDVTGAVDTEIPGAYTITYIATDAAGLETEVTRLVTVINAVPVAAAGEDQDFDCIVDNIDVVLSGSGSTDADGDVLTYSWSLGESVVSSEAVFTTNLPAGTHLYTLTVSDGFDSSSDIVQITIIADTEPPLITLEGENPMDLGLYLEYVEPGYAALDACGSEVVLGDSTDLNINVPGQYTITYTATDAGGNISTAERIVNVINTVPELVNEVNGIELSYGDNLLSTEIDLSTVFADVDTNDVLTFTFSHSNSDVVAVTLVDSILSFEAVNLGESLVEISATDPWSEMVTQSFTVVVNVTTDLADAVLFALEAIKINKNVEVFSGNLFVNQESNSSSSCNNGDDDDEDDDESLGKRDRHNDDDEDEDDNHHEHESYDLKIEKDVTIAAGYMLKADAIQIKKDASISSDVYSNQLDNTGDIFGDIYGEVETPLFVNMPPFKATVPVGQDITVRKRGELILEPGNYGRITVKEYAILTFTGGEYIITKIESKKSSHIRFEESSVIVVEDEIKVARNGYFGPAGGSYITAADIIFYVDGDHHAFELNEKALFYGTVYAPNAEVKIKKGTAFTGAILASKIDVGKEAEIILDSYFSQATGLGKSGRVAWVEPEMEMEIPEVSALAANYPNPFNPSTTIDFALSKPGEVALKIYDIRGAEVEVIARGFYEAGHYTVNFSPENMSSGTYLYVLTSGKFREVKRMVYLK